jgi:hypothetical protein
MRALKPPFATARAECVAARRISELAGSMQSLAASTSDVTVTLLWRAFSREPVSTSLEGARSSAPPEPKPRTWQKSLELQGVDPATSAMFEYRRATLRCRTGSERPVVPDAQRSSSRGPGSGTSRRHACVTDDLSAAAARLKITAQGATPTIGDFG